MPANKNASFRYRVIDEALRNTGRRWSLEDLIDKVSDELYEHFAIDKGVSKRTVQGDINVMRSDPPRGFAAPIVCKDGYYYYEDVNFSIQNNPLNEVDIDNLKEAVSILKQFQHLPIYEELGKVLGKLHDGLRLSDMESFIIFDHNLDYKNIDFLGSIYKLLKSGCKAKFFYKSFKHNIERVYLLEPLVLKEYRHRWFLFGWNAEYADYSVLAVDRIQSFEAMPELVCFSNKKELQSLLDAIVGVTIPTNKQLVNIEFFVDQFSFDYVLTKPLHHSQKLLSNNENGGFFSITVYPNYELEQVFMSFGEHVRIISPDFFRLRIVEGLQRWLENYSVF